MELLWQNGPVVMQSQNQRSMIRRNPDQSTVRDIRSSQEEHNQNHLFMQEDEMAAWLHYPLVDEDPALDHNFCSDLLYPSTNNTTTLPFVRSSHVTDLRPTVTATATSRPPIPPSKAMMFGEVNQTAQSSSKRMVGGRESTMVDSSETPVVVGSVVGASMSGAAVDAGASSAAGGMGVSAKEMMTCEMTVTSSPGCSSASAEPAQKPPTEDRKRKAIEADDADCNSEVCHSLSLSVIVLSDDVSHEIFYFYTHAHIHSFIHQKLRGSRSQFQSFISLTRGGVSYVFSPRVWFILF